MTTIFDFMPVKHKVRRLYPGGVIVTCLRDGRGVPFKRFEYLTTCGKQDLEFAPIGIRVMTWHEFDAEWKDYVNEIRSNNNHDHS